MSAERFYTVQRVRFGDLDAMQPVGLRPPTAGFAGSTPQIVSSYRASPSPRRAPAFFGDLIRTYIWPADLKRSSLKLGFEMRAEGDERVLADGWGTLVGYDYEAGESRPIPDELRKRIEPQMLDRVSRRA